jgi:glycosyltransferase involved in cell wall biosynthesis
MKIAFIVPYVPNQVRTRPYNLIIHLTRLGHDVDVFTVGTGKQDLVDAQALKSKCRNVYFYNQPVWRSLFNSAVAVPSGKPLQSVYSLQIDLLEHLREIFNNGRNDSKYDLIHIEHLRGSEYGVFLKSRFPSLPIVWDSVDCISHLFRQAAGQSKSLFGRFVTRFELGRTQKTEASLLHTFDHVLVTSDQDRMALLSTVRNGQSPAPVSILSNGVDQDYFKPNPSIQREPVNLIFSGKMSYHANISMANYLVDEIMPVIWRKRPDVRLIIAGKDPGPGLRKMQENPRIHVTGTVQDIRPFLWRSTVAVTPLVYGAGVQNKILEAMSVGLPVVSTSKSLLSLRATPGSEIIIGETPVELAAEILNLLDDHELRQRVSGAGRAYVCENHNWDKISEQLSAIYRQLTPSDPPILTN